MKKLVIKTTNKGIGTVPGFLSLGKNIGIKKEGKDFAILYSQNVCSVAAVYTKNMVKGAPLHVTKKHLRNGKAQAIVVNSGCSNVATGAKGLENAKKTAVLAAKELGIKTEDVLVASTGVIGKQLPMDKIEKGIKGIKSELADSGDDFAQAILTTDTVKKEVSVDADRFRISGAAKGSGMIHPDMATMLAFMVTDAKVLSKDLERCLKNSVDKSFNMVNVDMDTSTSDMAVVLANGMAGEVDAEEFQKALDLVCVELAKMIAKDGEGATKMIIAKVRGAKSLDDAKRFAKSVVNSTLLKCAVFGRDPNWGRILCALGNSGAKYFDGRELKVKINGLSIFENGKESKTYDGKKLSLAMKENSVITIDLNMGSGNFCAEAYGCDMTYDYVKINAEYLT